MSKPTQDFQRGDGVIVTQQKSTRHNQAGIVHFANNDHTSQVQFADGVEISFNNYDLRFDPSYKGGDIWTAERH